MLNTSLPALNQSFAGEKICEPHRWGPHKDAYVCHNNYCRRRVGAQNLVALVFLGVEPPPHYMVHLRTALLFAPRLHLFYLVGGCDHAHRSPFLSLRPRSHKRVGPGLETSFCSHRCNKPGIMLCPTQCLSVMMVGWRTRTARVCEGVSDLAQVFTTWLLYIDCGDLCCCCSCGIVREAGYP